ncbi:MAG: rhomboid family intramembrane serine protease [Pseudomonadota bacterium]
MISAILSTLKLIFIIGVGFLIQKSFQLGHLGILARDFGGLKGVFFSPLLHADLRHLLTNCGSLLSLGPFFFYASRRDLPAPINLWFLSGVFTWLLGRGGAYHIGASGLIFSMLGYLMGLGFFRRDFRSLFISILAVFLYHNALWGLLPSLPHVSWEGHLGGFIAGLIVAKFR